MENDLMPLCLSKRAAYVYAVPIHNIILCSVCMIEISIKKYTLLQGMKQNNNIWFYDDVLFYNMIIRNTYEVKLCECD